MLMMNLKKIGFLGFTNYEIEGKRCNDVVVPVNGGLQECLKVLECPLERDVFVWSARHGRQLHCAECTRRRRGHDEANQTLILWTFCDVSSRVSNSNFVNSTVCTMNAII